MTNPEQRDHPQAGDAQRTGGGGPVPTPSEQEPRRPEPSGEGGVDLKTSDLPDD